MNRRTTNSLVSLLLSLSLGAGECLAQASFEGEQSGLSRVSFDLFGGQIGSLGIDSSGRVYAGLYAPNGIFCLDSGSTEWRDPVTGSDLGSVSGLAVGSTAGTAFVIGGTSLFKTTDGCQTWSEVTGSSGSAQQNNYGFQIAFGHNTLLVETRGGTLDRSTDNGVTFSNVSVATGIQDIIDIAVSPTANEFYILAGSNNNAELYRSTDGGATWTSTGKSGSYRNVAVDNGNALRLALATDSGGVELSINSATSFSTLTPPDTSKTSLIFINGRLYKGSAYTDDFSSWQVLPDTTGGADIVGPVAGDPSNPSNLVAGSELGVARSINAGSSLTDVTSGMHGVRVHDIVQAEDKNVVFLASEQGLAKTSNFLDEAGPSWTFPVIIDSTRIHKAVYSLHLDENDPTRMYAGLIGGEMWLSSDNGATWTRATSDSVNGSDILDIHEVSDGTLYAAYASRMSNEGGILRSTDNGATWSIVPHSGVAIDANTLSSVGTTLFVGMGDDREPSNSLSGVYSFDGSNWIKLSGAVNGQVISALATSDTTLIAASAPDVDQSGGVFYSEDSGVTWTEVTANGLRTSGGWYRTLAVDPTRPEILFVAHGRPAGATEIYYSQDRGVTWTLLYQGLKDEVPSVMLVDDLTIGSGVGFSGISVADGVTVEASVKKRKLACALRSGSSPLAGEQVTYQLSRKGKFTSKKTKLTNSSGRAIFPLKKLRKGSRVRCTFLTELSKTKKIR